MPYRSKAQQRKLHELAKEGKISQKVVSELDHASKSMKLPERVTPKPKSSKTPPFRVKTLKPLK